MIPKGFTPRGTFLGAFVPGLWWLALAVLTLQAAAFAQQQALVSDSPTSTGLGAASESISSPSLSSEPASDPSPSSDPGAEVIEITEPALEILQPALGIVQPELDPVSKRLFGVIPNYRADQAADAYKPLTTAEKYKIAQGDSFDWPNFPLLAGYALQAQVTSGGFSHNGGIKGFGEFYARGFGDQVIGSYLTEAILPSALHEDPRFFRVGTGTFWHRISYAASRIFVTRGDNGRNRLFVSEIVGNIGVVAVTSLYYPQSQSVGQGAERYAVQLGNDAVSNILTEFWPDIRLRLRFVRHYLFPH